MSGLAEHSVSYEHYVEVRVVINDPSVVARCVENQDGDGVPQEDIRGGTGWRNTFYNIDTEQEVVRHLAYNCALNNVDRVNRLDGWADCTDDAATMAVVSMEEI